MGFVIHAYTVNQRLKRTLPLMDIHVYLLPVSALICSNIYRVW